MFVLCRGINLEFNHVIKVYCNNNNNNTNNNNDNDNDNDNDNQWNYFIKIL